MTTPAAEHNGVYVVTQHTKSNEKTHGRSDRYPARPPFFAHRFSRLVAKSCVANEHGPAAAYLLVVIALQEDAKRYTGPVTYWDAQLLPIIGIRSHTTLASIRDRLTDGGWLHYTAGSRARPARYWVTVPAHVAELDDQPIDAGDAALIQDSIASKNGSKLARSCDDPDGDIGSILARSWLPSSLSLSLPNSDPKESAHTIIPAGLVALIDRWNALPDGIAPRVIKRDSREILRAWSRASKDAEAGPLLQDAETVMATIRESTYLHGQSWFRFPWLLKQDSARVTWNIVKVMDGRYRASATKADRSRRQTMDAIRRFANDE